MLAALASILPLAQAAGEGFVRPEGQGPTSCVGQNDTVYFYAAIGFLAGFSERWARVIVGGALAGTAAPPSKAEDDTADEPEPDDDEQPPGTQFERTTTRETVRTSR